MKCSRTDNGLLIPTCDLVKNLSIVHIKWINYVACKLYQIKLFKRNPKYEILTKDLVLMANKKNCIHSGLIKHTYVHTRTQKISTGIWHLTFSFNFCDNTEKQFFKEAHGKVLSN